MPRFHRISPIRAVIGAILVLLVFGPSSTWSQDAGKSFDPFGYAVDSSPYLRRVIEEDHPGATNPMYPFLHLPNLRGELSVRPIFASLQQGRFNVSSSALAMDFLKDLGFVDQAIFIESMIRLQYGRYSIRGYYDAYVRTLRGNNANFTWPDVRIGGDLDLYERDGLRFGVDLDFSWQRPTFSFAGPAIGNGLIEWPRPVTVGLHLAYNPPKIGTVSSSFELRYRRPIRTGTRIQEFDIAGGISMPRTVLGTSTLRGGWRYTSMEYDSGDTQIDVKWSGIFAEYVYFY